MLKGTINNALIPSAEAVGVEALVGVAEALESVAKAEVGLLPFSSPSDQTGFKTVCHVLTAIELNVVWVAMAARAVPVELAASEEKVQTVALPRMFSVPSQVAGEAMVAMVVMAVAAAVAAVEFPSVFMCPARALRAKTPMPKTINSCHLAGRAMVDKVAVQRAIPDRLGKTDCWLTWCVLTALEQAPLRRCTPTMLRERASRQGCALIVMSSESVCCHVSIPAKKTSITAR